MVNFNPGLSQLLIKVFLTKDTAIRAKQKHYFTPKYSADNTKCYSKQYIGRKITKTEQKVNPGLALIGLSGNTHRVLSRILQD